jgi:hypothetical protein
VKVKKNGSSCVLGLIIGLKVLKVGVACHREIRLSSGKTLKNQSAVVDDQVTGFIYSGMLGSNRWKR